MFGAVRSAARSSSADGTSAVSHVTVQVNARMLVVSLANSLVASRRKYAVTRIWRMHAMHHFHARRISHVKARSTSLVRSKLRSRR